MRGSSSGPKVKRSDCPSGAQLRAIDKRVGLNGQELFHFAYPVSRRREQALVPLPSAPTSKLAKTSRAVIGMSTSETSLRHRDRASQFWSTPDALPPRPAVPDHLRGLQCSQRCDRHPATPSPSRCRAKTASRVVPHAPFRSTHASLPGAPPSPALTRASRPVPHRMIRRPRQRECDRRCSETSAVRIEGRRPQSVAAGAVCALQIDEMSRRGVTGEESDRERERSPSPSSRDTIPTVRFPPVETPR